MVEGMNRLPSICKDWKWSCQLILQRVILFFSSAFDFGVVQGIGSHLDSSCRGFSPKTLEDLQLLCRNDIQSGKHCQIIHILPPIPLADDLLEQGSKLLCYEIRKGIGGNGCTCAEVQNLCVRYNLV